MCKLCYEIRPEGWNFCPLCGQEINIPRYNPNDTFEDLVKRVGIVLKANWTGETREDWYDNFEENK